MYLGSGTGDHFNQMAFSIEKSRGKSNRSRALGMAQDLKAIHGLNARGTRKHSSTEILARLEVIRTIYKVVNRGISNTAAAGVFDLDIDSNGRWSVEKFKGLFQIERDYNMTPKNS